MNTSMYEHTPDTSMIRSDMNNIGMLETTMVFPHILFLKAVDFVFSGTGHRD